jgi:hypothetical protein
MDDLKARPCEVDGRPALFHRWIEEDRALLQFNAVVTPGDANAVFRDFDARGIVPPFCHTEVLRETLALVEYRDGTLDKVKPEQIRFTGKEGQI